MTTRDEILGNRPTGPVVEAEALRGHLEGRVLVVLDDDPTGTQSVADLPVLLGWTPEDFVWAFGTGAACDAVVIVPAFPDAGRITVGSIHYAGSVRDGFTPVAETEFARESSRRAASFFGAELDRQHEK